MSQRAATSERLGASGPPAGDKGGDKGGKKGGRKTSKGVGKAGKDKVAEDPDMYVRCVGCSYKWNFRAKAECYSCGKSLGPAAVDQPVPMSA